MVVSMCINFCCSVPYKMATFYICCLFSACLAISHLFTKQGLVFSPYEYLLVTEIVLAIVYNSKLLLCFTCEEYRNTELWLLLLHCPNFLYCCLKKIDKLPFQVQSCFTMVVPLQLCKFWYFAVTAQLKSNTSQ